MQPSHTNKGVVEEDTTASLVSRSIKALKWSYLGSIVRIFMQLIAQIALARLLGPDIFGIVAAVILVLTLSSLIAEMGLGPAIVQTRDLSPQRIRVAFTRVMLAGLVAACVLFLSADRIAQFFGNPEITEVLRWLLPSFLLQALGVVSLALLKRNLDFKAIQLAQISGYFLGFLVTGVICASLGVGVWSLVAAWTVQNLLQSVIMYLHVRHHLAPALSSDSTNDTRFGAKVVLTNIANWAIENIDNLIVGRFFGTQALGNYAVAYNLVRTPTNHAVSSVQQVMFPASAQAQNEPEKLSIAYFSAVWAIGLMTFPVFFGIGAVAKTFVVAVYGDKWSDAAALLLPLALAMPLHAVMAVAGPLLWGRGEVGRELSVQFWVALILIAVLLFAATWSAAAIAWAVLFVYLIRAAWLHGKVANSLGIPYRRVLSALATGATTATTVCLVLLISDEILLSHGLAPALCITVEASLALITLLITLYQVIGIFSPPELRPQLIKLAGRLPPIIGRPLRARINP